MVKTREEYQILEDSGTVRSQHIEGIKRMPKLVQDYVRAIGASDVSKDQIRTLSRDFVAKLHTLSKDELSHLHDFIGVQNLQSGGIRTLRVSDYAFYQLSKGEHVDVAENFQRLIRGATNKPPTAKEISELDEVIKDPTIVEKSRQAAKLAEEQAAKAKEAEFANRPWDVRVSDARSAVSILVANGSYIDGAHPKTSKENWDKFVLSQMERAVGGASYSKHIETPGMGAENFKILIQEEMRKQYGAVPEGVTIPPLKTPAAGAAPVTPAVPGASASGSVPSPSSPPVAPSSGGSPGPFSGTAESLKSSLDKALEHIKRNHQGIVATHVAAFNGAKDYVEGEIEKAKFNSTVADVKAAAATPAGGYVLAAPGGLTTLTAQGVQHALENPTVQEALKTVKQKLSAASEQMQAKLKADGVVPGAVPSQVATDGSKTKEQILEEAPTFLAGHLKTDEGLFNQYVKMNNLKMTGSSDAVPSGSSVPPTQVATSSPGAAPAQDPNAPVSPSNPYGRLTNPERRSMWDEDKSEVFGAGKGPGGTGTKYSSSDHSPSTNPRDLPDPKAKKGKSRGDGSETERTA